MPVFAENDIRVTVSVVIVLYRMEPAQSPAFQSVTAARAMLDVAVGDIQVLLWDNSPLTSDGRALPEGVHYFSDPGNSGLATAYNRAIEWASCNGSEWLLTLDQDTAIHDDFFVKMAAAARDSTRYAGIGAIVPQIAAGSKQLSPNYFRFGAIPQWYRPGFVGVPGEPVFAFNSGAMLKVAALKQVGGYDPRFWLDDSDAMIFSKLHEHGKRVFVAGDIQVEHEFSMKNMQKRMSPERYRNALFAETAFWDMRMTRAAGWERTLTARASAVQTFVAQGFVRTAADHLAGINAAASHIAAQTDRGVARRNRRSCRGFGSGGTLYCQANDIRLHGGIQRRSLRRSAVAVDSVAVDTGR